MIMKKHFRAIMPLLFTLTALSASAQYHWESIVVESNEWNYQAATSEPASNWNQPGFNYNSWPLAAGGFGYGDSDDRTTIPSCNSLYMIYKFTLPDVSLISELLLDIDYDDAFVFYLNGKECARSTNVSDASPAYNAAVSADHEARMYSGGSPERIKLSAASLTRGLNTIAVHVLNIGSTSSDMSARVFLHAKVHYAYKLWQDPPAWFEEPISFESSNLPLMFIDTKGSSIIQDTKINVQMKVLDNPLGENNVSDTTYSYLGKAGIEIRGFSSAWVDKKSYTVETRMDYSDSSRNVKLMGMPKENDWVFNGPYMDKSLMRNVLAYNLGNKMGQWAPRTRFFEMYLNNVYKGVYVLIEKIKNDKNRLNLAEINPQDTVGDELTGGYILKIDRPDPGDVEGLGYWFSPYRAWTRIQQQVPFVFVDPDWDQLDVKQRNYIRNQITKFEDAMYSDDYKDREKGYYPYINVQSFVDYYILNELGRNLDGYRVSTYLYKDKDSKGGKITMGPFWDYNISFGNANFFAAGNTQGWIIDGMGDADSYAMPFWWEKLRLDPYFNSRLKNRWNELRSKYINDSYLNHMIDSCALELSNAQKRNFKAWNILSTYVWPNNYVGGTYENEIIYLKTWLKDRISWMDSQIQPLQDITSGTNELTDFPMDLVCYPNPYVDVVNFKFAINQSAEIRIRIQDILGRVVYEDTRNYSSGFHQETVDLNRLRNDSYVYVYQVFRDGKLRNSGKLIRQEQEGYYFF